MVARRLYGLHDGRDECIAAAMAGVTENFQLARGPSLRQPPGG